MRRIGLVLSASATIAGIALIAVSIPLAGVPLLVVGLAILGIIVLDYSIRSSRAAVREKSPIKVLV